MADSGDVAEDVLVTVEKVGGTPKRKNRSNPGGELNYNGLTQFLMQTPHDAVRIAYGDKEHPDYLESKEDLFKRRPGYFLAALDLSNRGAVIRWTQEHGW